MTLPKHKFQTNVVHPVTGDFVRSDLVAANEHPFLHYGTVAFKLFEQELDAIERSNPVPAPLTEQQLKVHKRPQYVPCPVLARVPVMHEANWDAFAQRVYDGNLEQYTHFKQLAARKPYDRRLSATVLANLPHGHSEKWSGLKHDRVQMAYYRTSPMVYVMPGALNGLSLSHDFKPFARFMLDQLMRLRGWDSTSGPKQVPSNDVFASLVVGCPYVGSNPVEVRTDITRVLAIIGAVYCAKYTTWSPQPLACSKLAYHVLGAQIVRAMLGMYRCVSGHANGYGAEYGYFTQRHVHQGMVPTWDSIEPLWLSNDPVTEKALQDRFDTVVRVIPLAADLMLQLAVNIVKAGSRSGVAPILPPKTRSTYMSAVTNCVLSKQAKQSTEANVGTGYLHLRGQTPTMNCVTAAQIHVRNLIISEPLVHSPFHWTRSLKDAGNGGEELELF